MALLAHLSETNSRPWCLDNHDELHGGVSSPRRRGRPQLIVRPASKSLVVPATATDHPEWLPLTNLDRVVNPTFVSVIFFYEGVLSDKGSGELSFSTVTASLKESLAKVLVDFYPLAGRLALKDETGVVDLHCNDAGAIFIEASVNAELKEVGGPQPMPMLSGMDSMNAAASLGPGLVYIPDQITPAIPVLVIQATRFTCGSVAVAANWHHTVADAFSGCHFMRSWAQVSTGQPLSLQPSHDRQLLKPRSPLNPSMVSNGAYSSSQKSKEQTTVQPQGYETGSTWSDHSKDRPTAAPAAPVPVVKPFFLSSDTVRKIKESTHNDSTGNSDAERPFTSAESVSGGLWKLMTRARSVDDENILRGERSRFFMFVDGRKRLGLPTGYFGNVVCHACAESTQGELLSKPVSYAASLIRRATRAIDGDYFLSLIDWVEERGIMSTSRSSDNCKSEHVNSVGYDVAATFWTFLPLYEINFGWGRPVLSVRNAPPRNLIDGISMMPGPPGSGSMVALLNLQADRMHNLEQNPQFRDAVKPFDLKSMNPESSSSRCSIQSHSNRTAIACN